MDGAWLVLGVCVVLALLAAAVLYADIRRAKGPRERAFVIKASAALCGVIVPLACFEHRIPWPPGVPRILLNAVTWFLVLVVPAVAIRIHRDRIRRREALEQAKPREVET